MITMKNITDINDVTFNSNFEMESSWIVNVEGLSVQNIKHLHKVEYFSSLEDLKKFVRRKFNYYVRQGLKKGTNGSVFIETV